MAKADPTRNYYADLEISPDADITEIKKQFKKLALLYHPDRNQGHEKEFNSKFQAIQSAHEILTDPQERAKYDRIRANYAATRPSMPGRNPYTATSYYPPPPRRTQTQKQPQSQQRPLYGTGAANRTSQYSKFEPHYSKFEPTSKSQSAEQDEAKARAANQYKAWQNMYGRPAQSDGRSAQNGTSRPRSPPIVPPRAPPPSGPPPSLNRSQSTRTSRRTGFAPNDPNGDEPPAKSNAAYYNVPRGDPLFSSRDHSRREPSPEVSPTSKRPDLPQREMPRATFAAKVEDFSTDPRSTPYATAGGEKLNLNNPFSESFARSASLNAGSNERKAFNPSSLHNVTSAGSSDRHRSASPPRRRYDSDYQSGYKTSHGTPGDSPPRRTNSAEAHLRHGKEQNGGSYRPRRAVINEDETSSDTDRYAKETCDTMTQEDLERRKEKKKRSPKTVKAKVRRPSLHQESYDRGSSRTSADYRPPVDRFDSMDLGGKVPRETSGLGSNGIKSDSSKYGLREIPTSPASSTSSSSSSLDSQAGVSLAGGLATPVAKPSHSVFPSLRRSLGGWTFVWVPESANTDSNPFSYTMPPPRDSSFVQNQPATADPNTQFRNVPSAWPSEQIFSEPQMMDNRDRVGSRDSNSRVRPSSKTQSSFQQAASGLGQGASMNGAVPVPPAKVPLNPASPNQSTFSAEDWEKDFNKPNIFHPSSPTRSKGLHTKRSDSRMKRSRTRPAKPTKRSSANKHPSVDVSIDSSDSEEEIVIPPSWRRDSKGRASGASSGRDSNAMDIDPATPRNGSFSRSHPSLPGAEAKRSDSYRKSRSYEAEGARPETRKESSFSKGASSTAGKGRAVPPPPIPPRAPSPPGGLHMGDLKNVEPLGRSGSGLRDMNDLGTNLPFESRAASNPPIPAYAPPRLELPMPPRAPAEPSTGSLTNSSWNTYLQQMKAYMVKWSQFNQKMLDHFNTRQDEVRDLSTNWISVPSEGESGGFLKYMKGVDEDMRVREHWNVAFEHHRETMKGLGRLRETVRAKQARV